MGHGALPHRLNLEDSDDAQSASGDGADEKSGRERDSGFHTRAHACHPFRSAGVPTLQPLPDCCVEHAPRGRHRDQGTAFDQAPVVPVTKPSRKIRLLVQALGIWVWVTAMSSTYQPSPVTPESVP